MSALKASNRSRICCLKNTEMTLHSIISEGVKNSVSMEILVSLERVRYVFFNVDSLIFLMSIVLSIYSITTARVFIHSD